MIIFSKDQGAKRDDKDTEEDRTTRLFVKIPKEWTKTELYDAFKNFGNIDYANVIKDRNTNESRGFGFVKFFKYVVLALFILGYRQYYSLKSICWLKLTVTFCSIIRGKKWTKNTRFFQRFSDAAKAFEECDKNFRAVFAEPKHTVANKKIEENRFSGFNDSFRDIPINFRNNSRTDHSFLPSSDLGKRDEFTGLIVSCSPMLTQEEIWRLFDVVPGNISFVNSVLIHWIFCIFLF